MPDANIQCYQIPSPLKTIFSFWLNSCFLYIFSIMTSIRNKIEGVKERKPQKQSHWKLWNRAPKLLKKYTKWSANYTFRFRCWLRSQWRPSFSIPWRERTKIRNNSKLLSSSSECTRSDALETTYVGSKRSGLGRVNRSPDLTGTRPEGP